MKKILVFVSVFLCINVFLLESVFADTRTIGITLSPAISEIEIDESNEESQEQTVPLVLSNQNNEAVSFTITASDFEGDDTESEVRFFRKEEHDATAARNVIRTDVDTVELAPGEEKTIVVHIRGRDLTPGSHYGALHFQSGIPQSGTKIHQPVALQQTLTALFFIKNSGDIRSEQSLTEMNITRQWLQFPTEIELHFYNGGTIDSIPRGFVSIKNSRNVEKGRGVINSESLRIFPQKNRVFSLALMPFGDIFLPGWYTVSAHSRPNDAQDFIVTEKTIFIFPVVSGVLLTMVLGGILWIRWKICNVRAKQKK